MDRGTEEEREEAMTQDERVAAFKEGFKKLVLETGIAVGGCGCCNSPYIDDVTKRWDRKELKVVDVEITEEVAQNATDRLGSL